MSGILDGPEWVLEPPRQSVRPGNGPLDRMIEHLKRAPGTWAIVAEYDSNSSASSTGNKFKRSGCEMVTSGGRIYARWPEEGSA